jgi:hypothetical protein
MPSENSSNAPLEAEASHRPDVDRRDADRRERPTRPWIGTLGPLRRIHGRRDADRAGYVDRYSRRDVALILAVFVMNVGDAFFTMLWLGRGGEEANPIMDFFLDIGPWAFLVQKCVVVGIWLVVLLVHKNFRFARIGLYVSLVAYAVLMIVHFGIIATGIDPPKGDDIEHSQTIPERDHLQASTDRSATLQPPVTTKRSIE